jgi:hypothetical protein
LYLTEEEWDARGRSVRQRSTPAAVQEAMAQAKAVGTAEVALYQAGRRASPPTTSVGAVAR